MSSQSPFSATSLPPTRRRRAQIACRNCRKRKIRCVTNEEPPHDPCERCQRMNLVCEYVAVGDPSPPSTPTQGTGLPNPQVSSYSNGPQGLTYNATPNQHSRHPSASHPNYPSHTGRSEGIQHGQSHPLYPSQSSMSNPYLGTSSWPEQDIKPSLNDFRGVPAPYPTPNSQYYHNHHGPMDNSQTGHNSWGLMNQQMSRGYDGYSMPLNSVANFGNAGQTYDALSYGMNSRAYTTCVTCQQRHCICPHMRRAT